MTNVGPDVQDLYEEKFDPADPKRYQTAAGWRDAEVRHEEIKVRKGFTDSATDSVAVRRDRDAAWPDCFEKRASVTPFAGPRSILQSIRLIPLT